MPKAALVALLAIITACATGPVMTPATGDPTPNQTATPRTSPAPSSTMATRSPSASLLVDHPTGPNDVVLRMSIGGGLRYPGATVEEPPVFTLYGDGRVIYASAAQVPADVSGRYDLWQARMNEEQIAALVEYALDDALLAVARDRYADIPIADDVTTTFEIHAAGVDRSVAVYALGYDAPDVPDAKPRAAFRRLADELSRFGERVESGEVVGVGAFDPPAYLVTLDQPFGPDAPPADWPWEDLDVTAFERAQAGWWTAVLDREHAAKLSDPLNDVPDNHVVLGPDGNHYLVRVRPLLPDQVP